MLKVPLENPKPDFNYVLDVFSGRKKQDRVVFIELLIDEEIQQYIIENHFGGKYSPPPPRIFGTSEGESKANTDLGEDKEARHRYLKQAIDLFYRLGYDFFPELEYFWKFESLNTIAIETKDTAALSKGNRSWGNEGEGMIKSWEDFEKFSW